MNQQIVEFVQAVLIPVLALLPVVWLYASALSRGLACARDDQHRLAPLSPWSFLWIGGRKDCLRLLLLGPVCFVLIFPLRWLSLIVISDARGIPASLPAFSEWIRDFALDLATNSGVRRQIAVESIRSVGSLGFTFAAMTLLAPRISAPVRLVPIGLPVMIALAWAHRLLRFPFRVDLPDTMQFTLLFALSGVSTLAFVWLYARVILNRRWFRFPKD